jgi:hypothetical protein
VKDRPGGIDGLKNRSGKCEGSTGGGLDGLKNRRGKCEGPAGGARRVKELEWEMRRTRVAGGGTNGCLKRKVFLKNQKHRPNIVEITHLCIMHGVHTSIYIYICRDQIKGRVPQIQDLVGGARVRVFCKFTFGYYMCI